MVHRSAFPFTRDPRLDYTHRQVVSKIYDPAYEFALPQLSEKTWDTVCGSDSEKERLEFVGDALMSAAVAEELYAAYKQKSPGFYSRTRSVLTANSTFAHLMHKAGFHDLDKPVKPAGDAFETIIAAYQKEYGHDVLRSWLKQFFLPLIWAAGEAHERYMDTIVCYRYKNYQSRPYYRQRAPPLKFTPKKPTPIRKHFVAAVSPSLQRTKPTVSATADDTGTDESEWEDLIVEDMSARASYRPAVAPSTPKAGALSRKFHELTSSTRELLRSIKNGSPSRKRELPETPTPAAKLQQCRRHIDGDGELAERFRRTPMLGRITKPVKLNIYHIPIVGDEDSDMDISD